MEYSKVFIMNEIESVICWCFVVVVEAKPDLPALNMDTILFLEGRKVMGQVLLGGLGHLFTIGLSSLHFQIMTLDFKSDV